MNPIVPAQDSSLYSDGGELDMQALLLTLDTVRQDSGLCEAAGTVFKLEVSQLPGRMPA